MCFFFTWLTTLILGEFQFSQFLHHLSTLRSINENKKRKDLNYRVAKKMQRLLHLMLKCMEIS
jgi:hypothetical protein